MNILVIGGDSRQTYLVKNLNNLGYNAEHLTKNKKMKEKIEKSDVIILPLPATKNGNTIFNTFDEDSIYISDLKEFIKDQKILTSKLIIPGKNCLDYSELDSFAIKNAVPTAEGAIAIAIENSKKTIFKSNCLVIGNGRIGKILASKLYLLGADVTISARKSIDKAYISAFNMKYAQTSKISEIANNFDMIFNTVNYPLIDSDFFANCKQDSVFIELASMPGSIIKGANTGQCLVINAQGLPGKFSPITAADILTETVIELANVYKGEIL